MNDRSVCPEGVERLRKEAEVQQLAAGLDGCQWALAHRGVVVAHDTLGVAADTRFVGFSTTKMVMATLAWGLADDGVIDLDAPVSSYVVEFETDALRAVSVSHLLCHTAGFPEAVIDPLAWDPPHRSRQLSAIALAWPPGSRFCYHPSSSMWVLAEVIERALGVDYREALMTRVIEPLGLSQQLCLGLTNNTTSVAMVNHVGSPPPPARVASLGLNLSHDTVDYRAYIESFNTAEMQARGVPSAGLIGTASGLALLYQSLLGHGPAVCSPQVVARALTNQTGDMLDPMNGRPARRGLGAVLAWDKEKHFRGFGIGCSDRTFGHMGAGGQVAWADPERELSFVFFTNSHDRDVLRQGMRMVKLSTMAAATVPAGAGTQ